ncbi:hypothetical protein HS961_05990 [Comamonas piscis]|uniref:Uncharacterized protein n=1 Tax=Comamonas piscis TaxID=1562974 RepID=A0A7G5EEJ5_9BURK|nr:hypothetical protein [Comamonas piscis]QMV72420.1 hypothetical protein HS961_05990 [Comamonas piscis]WSO35187.1 hypothetical protein VUJ63_06015 [Comamonas piscis]
MNYEDVLYLDLEFLSDIYESKTGIASRTVISRKEGINAEAGISFLKSGLNSEVTKQYTASAQGMFKEVAKLLDKYSEHSPDFQPGTKPTTLWVQGAFTIGRWGEQENSERSLNVFFEVKAGEISYSLLPKNQYFLSNLEALEIISPALQRFIQMPVHMLCKVLYPLPDIQAFVVTPYVIVAANS